MRTLIHLWVEPMIMNHQRCAEKVFFDYIIEGDFTNLSNQKIDDIILGSKMQDIMDFADIDSNWDYGVLYAKATNKKPSISFAKSEEEIVREKEQKQALVKLEKESRKLDAEIQKIVSGKKDLVLTKENLTMQDNGIIDINVPSLKLTDKFDFSKIWDTIENKFLGKIKDGDRITLTDSDGNKIFDMQGGGCLNVGLADIRVYDKKTKSESDSLFSQMKGLNGGLFIREDGSFDIGDTQRTFYLKIYTNNLVKASLKLGKSVNEITSTKLLEAFKNNQKAE